jgi:hypothetical protein
LSSFGKQNHMEHVLENMRSHIIVLLGYLVESFKTAFSEVQVNQLLQLCLNTLEAQLQQPSHTLLAGAMKCLDSLLTWFDDELPAGGSVVNSRRCFEYIEQVLWPREDLKRYEALRGISLHTVGISHYAICLLELHAREVIEIFLIF